MTAPRERRARAIWQDEVTGDMRHGTWTRPVFAQREAIGIAARRGAVAHIEHEGALLMMADVCERVAAVCRDGDLNSTQGVVEALLAAMRIGQLFAEPVAPYRLALSWLKVPDSEIDAAVVAAYEVTP